MKIAAPRGASRQENNYKSRNTMTRTMNYVAKKITTRYTTY